MAVIEIRPITVPAPAELPEPHFQSMLAAAAEHGLTSGLLRAGLDFAPAHVRLYVSPCDHAAQRFYRRWGFRRAGLTELAVGDATVPAVIMTRLLTPEPALSAPDLPDTRLL